ncbi:MAG: glycoside hydrolase family 3 N-terminal domain-containing protein [Candidatus Paceibacterota bacterium]
MIKKLIVLLVLSMLPFSSFNNEPSLDEKIGEMIMLGFRGTSVSSSSKIIKDINEYHIGGVVLFDYDQPSKSYPRNIESPSQVKKLIDDIKGLTNSSLFIAVDAEGGSVNRLKFLEIKSAEKMGKDAYTQAIKLGSSLKSLGFNLNFAPVVDVNVNPNNPVISKLERSFSDDPSEVSAFAGEFIRGMHEYNIMTSLKHFPGHGSSKEDSHLGLVDVTNTYNKEVEILPFLELMDSADMIMTAHIMNKNIDKENPATLSPLFLQSILREELGYNGVIISDDMQMGAITSNFTLEEAVVLAINAGCDILGFSNNGNEYDEDIAEKVFNIIKNNISEERINESYQRIKLLKEKYNLK